MVESLKDQLKERMTAAGVESLAGSEHKATYSDLPKASSPVSRPQRLKLFGEEVPPLILLYILLQPVLLLLDLAKLQK